MNHREQEDLETWVTEVEMAHELISKMARGEVEIDKLDQQEKERQQKQKLKEFKEREEAQKRQEQLVKGQPGKGEKKDTYVSFCKFCHWEWKIKLEKCNKCQNDTMTYEQRMEQLQEKLKEYKKKKVEKEDRNHKWEMWKKTQAMLWKKTSTNYSKWDYFTDSEEEEEKSSEPVLPTNDPQFKAMEADLNARKKKRMDDQKKADVFKEKANKLMAEQKYKEAIDQYEQAIDLRRDFKVCYTNRALAYIKLQEYDLAIKDCSKLLDYCEFLEDGWEKSKDLCVKAFVRRALCLKEKQDYKSAQEDCEQALTLIKNEKSATILLDEIKQIVKQNQQKEEFIQSEKQKEFKEIVDEMIQMDLDQMKSEQLLMLNILISKNHDARVYFLHQGGIKKTIQILKHGKISPYLLLNQLCDNDIVSQSEFIKQNGIDELLEKSNQILKILQENFDADQQINSSDISDIFENLTTISLQEKSRIYLQQSEKVTQFVLKNIQSIYGFYETYPQVAASFTNFVSNMCYGSISPLKTCLNAQLDQLGEYLVNMINSRKKTSKFIHLKENIYNLLSNLLTQEIVRKHFLQNDSFLQAMNNRLLRFEFQENSKWVKLGEALLGVFVNLLYQIQPEMQIKINKLQMLNSIGSFIWKTEKSDKNCKEVISRSLQCLSKMEFTIENFNCDLIHKCFMFFDQESIENNFTNHALRYFIKVYSSESLQLILQSSSIPLESYQELTKNLVQIMLHEDEQRFCNSCNLAGYIIQIKTDISQDFRQIIPKLISTVKDGQGNKRKNSAIFLAKLAKNPSNLEAIRALHGIEVLHSVQRFIVPQN